VGARSCGGLCHVPFGAAEAEAVGQFTLENFPVLSSLLLGQLKQAIVVLLEVFVLLDDFAIVLVATTGPATTTTTAAATTFATL
jgi:hypothetical protein